MEFSGLVMSWIQIDFWTVESINANKSKNLSPSKTKIMLCGNYTIIATSFIHSEQAEYTPRYFTFYSHHTLCEQ